MEQVRARAAELSPTDEPTIPNGVAEFLMESEGGEEGEPFLGVDKAATPAERCWSQVDLQKELDRARPQLLVPQRDSDAQKDVSGSRVGALAQFSNLALRTGSNLIDQFVTPYIPRVFNLTFRWCVGGPDFPNQPRWRRTFADSPSLPLDTFTSMIAKRCEYQNEGGFRFEPWTLESRIRHEGEPGRLHVDQEGAASWCEHS